MQPKTKMTFRFDGTTPREITHDALPDRVFDPKQHQVTASSVPARAIAQTPLRGMEPPSGRPIANSPVQSPAAKPGSASHAKKGARTRLPETLEMWPNSPYQDDIHALEEIIRQAEPGSASRKEPAALSADVDLSKHIPDDTTLQQGLPDQSAMRHRPLSAMPGGAASKRTASVTEPATKPLMQVVPQPDSEVRPISQSSSDDRKTHFAPDALRPVKGFARRETLWEETFVEDGKLEGRAYIVHPVPDAVNDEEARPSYAYTKTSEGPSWLRIFVSVAGAIVTGAVFGYLVLSLFTGEPLLPTKTDPANTQATPPVQAAGGSVLPSAAAGATSAPSQGQTAATGAGVSSASAAVPASTFYMLQYGVFRTADSMKEAMAELALKGIAGAADTSDGYRVYAGAAATKEDATALSNWMSGTAVYVKPLELRAIALADHAHAQKWADYLVKSGALHDLVARMTLSGIRQDQLAAYPKDQMQALEQAYSAWQATRTGESDWAGTSKSAVEDMDASLQAAVQDLKAYQAKPSRSDLRNAQASVMKAVLGDSQLRLALQSEVAKS